ncbi:hypothetical protein LOK49_LG06G03285 [Camellia lanceoleosa]|uniref:Uncharacterized protein n=1 Tax=Camellia lanceoleosa TaxID=1840588 RepID=A0ACC0H9M1_9ERIC|nr:hypothetical protein LOK49_LG06G03285 [Camellia lanceoleosa]
MALKSLLLVFLLIAALTAVPMAEAQLGLISGLLGLIRIQGTVFCTANGNMGVNGTSTPVFPNAKVQLQCGAGNTVSSATTNNSGIFSMVLDPLQFVLSSLLSNQNSLVKTPLKESTSTSPLLASFCRHCSSLETPFKASSTSPTLFPLDFNSSLT